MIAIGRALCGHGHEVTLVAGETYQAQVNRARLGFRSLDFPPDEWAYFLAAFSKPLPRFPQIIWDRPQRAFFARLAPLTAQLVDILRPLAPDVMLTDYNFYTEGAETIVALLERLASEHAPLRRPKGMSPTLYQPTEVEKLISRLALV
jgi:hypothetical protein